MERGDYIGVICFISLSCFSIYYLTTLKLLQGIGMSAITYVCEDISQEVLVLRMNEPQEYIEYSDCK